MTIFEILLKRILQKSLQIIQNKAKQKTNVNRQLIINSGGSINCLQQCNYSLQLVMYLLYVTSQISLLRVSVIVFSNKWLSLTLLPKAPLKFKTSRFQVKTATKRTSSMVYDSLEIHQVCVWCLLTNTMEKITKCDPNPHVLHILAHTKAFFNT